MPEVPKIVQERLRAAGGARGNAHPDANVLAAFAEQALAASEREGVLAHLANCEDCREVLAFQAPALEALPEAATAGQSAAVPKVETSRAGQRPWFAWNRLGWAGLAAGVAIAAGVLVHPGKSKVEDARQQPVVTAPPAVTTDKAAFSAPSSEVTSTGAAVGGVATTAENRPAAPVAVTRRDELKKKETLAPVPQEPPKVETTLQASAAQKDVQQKYAYATSSAPTVRESVEVNGVPAVATETQVANAVGANEAAPVFRAKAARAMDAPAAMAKSAPAGSKPADNKQADTNQADAYAKQAGASLGKAANTKEEAARISTDEVQELPLAGRNNVELPLSTQIPAQWTIREDKVQRSLDSGLHWKTVFKPRHRLLCVTAESSDVWAGGTGGNLFHSGNSGVAWSQVRPSINGQSLADDITSIKIFSATQVVLTTSKNESWSTSDAGVTWEKK